MRVICVIPARAGSKGIPGKNLRRVGGASLVARAIRAAREFVRAHDLTDARIVVDTDSEEIASEGRSWGADVPFLRAPELASDDASSVDSTLGLLERLQAAGSTFDAVVLLQPTSPLRTAEDVGRCWRAFIDADGASVTTVTEQAHPPELAVRLAQHDALQWVSASGKDGMRRQELDAAYSLTGAVYVTRVDVLRRDRAFIVSGVTRAVCVPSERSVDVDRPVDLDVAEGMLRSGRHPSMKLDQWTIGPGFPCFVIAEAGVNHNGRLDLAHRLIDAAVEARADAVKFQTFDPALLVADSAPKAEYQIAATGSRDSQREMLEALALPYAAFRELAEHARSSGILFLSTPFDERSADFLADLGCSALKIASGEVTNHRLLAALARKGLPLLMSSGMATLAEVSAAVDVIRDNGNPPLALFHCVTNYPADPADCNLRAMDSMRLTFDVPVGWSDHTEGVAISVAAAALGADLVEKHFTLDRTLPGPDHAASLQPDELRNMIAAIRAADRARGDGVKRPAASELPNLAVVRRSMHAARDIAVGTVLTSLDLVALRPAGGVPPSDERLLLGRTTTRAILKGEMLGGSDVA